MSNTPIWDGLVERMATLITSTDRISRIKERIAILEILETELAHVKTKRELAILNRIRDEIQERHRQKDN